MTPPELEQEDSEPGSDQAQVEAEAAAAEWLRKHKRKG